MKALKGQMHDDVICENYQNSSVCSFLVQIRYCFLNLGGIDEFI